MAVGAVRCIGLFFGVWNMNISAVWLRREGDEIVVEVEIGKRFVEVIRENGDAPISHIVEESGIAKAVSRQGQIAAHARDVATGATDRE